MVTTEALVRPDNIMYRYFIEHTSVAMGNLPIRCMQSVWGP
jgi:hypothetical protein